MQQNAPQQRRPTKDYAPRKRKSRLMAVLPLMLLFAALLGVMYLIFPKQAGKHVGSSVYDGLVISEVMMEITIRIRYRVGEHFRPLLAHSSGKRSGMLMAWKLVMAPIAIPGTSIIETMLSREKPPIMGRMEMIARVTTTLNFLVKNLGSQPSSAIPIIMNGIPLIPPSRAVLSEHIAPPTMKKTARGPGRTRPAI